MSAKRARSLLFSLAAFTGGWRSAKARDGSTVCGSPRCHKVFVVFASPPRSHTQQLLLRHAIDRSLGGVVWSPEHTHKLVLHSHSVASCYC